MRLGKNFNSIWMDIKRYVSNDRNSLIILFGDKYYGKTEMLQYFIEEDENQYKYLIKNDDMEESMSLIRICFLKVLASLYFDAENSFFLKISEKLKNEMNEKLRDAEVNYENVFETLKICLSECSTEYLKLTINSFFTEKTVLNFYVGFYHVFEGFDDDIKYMNELNDVIKFNFVIATRPHSEKMQEYLKRFSGVRCVDLVTKRLSPKTYKIVDEKTYFKMPIYSKFMEEKGLEAKLNVKEIINYMNANEYFRELDDEIGFGYIDSDNLLLLSIIMAAGYLDRRQIEFVFNIVKVQKNIKVKDFLKQYEFMWELQEKIFSGSIWGDFVLYNRYNGELKRQLDSFFSALLYSVFMNVPIRGKEVSLESLKELLANRKDYSFFVDGRISDAYHMLLSLAVSYKKHDGGEKGFIANPTNVVATDFLNKYVLEITENTLDFIIKLFDTTVNLDLILTYIEAIEKYIRGNYEIEEKLKIKMIEFLKITFNEADRWSDVTLLGYGIKCLDAMIEKDMLPSDVRYSMFNIGSSTIKETINQIGLGEDCMDKFEDKCSIDVLIVVSTIDEEKAILSCGNWSKDSSLKYDFFIYKEQGIVYALIRGISMGGEDAAVATSYFVDNLKPQAIAMVGFAAGREKKVLLGDVVVAHRVFKYDGGKEIGEKITLQEINSYSIKDKWKQIAERFGEEWRKSITINIPKQYEEQEIELLHEFTNEDRINIDKVYIESKYPDWEVLINSLSEHNYIDILSNKILKITKNGKKYINDFDVRNPMGYKGKEPSTKVGVVASGCKVQEWEGIFDEIEKIDRKVCALEMEGVAIGKVSSFNEIPFMMVKGIGDYARNGKSFANRYIEYACQSSFRFVVEFFTYLHYNNSNFPQDFLP